MIKGRKIKRIPQEKDIMYWLNKISCSEIKKRAKSNYRKYYMQILLGHESTLTYDKLFIALSSAFYFGDTPEGDRFWERINEALILGKDVKFEDYKELIRG